MSKDVGGLENQNVRQALKNTGLAEAAKGLKVEGGTNRTLDFKSTGEWLAQQEAHVSTTPTKDVARIDYTLNYLAELNTKAGQITNETLTQNIDAHTANIRKRIDSSTNLIADLTEIPQGTPVIDGKPRIDQTDLAASICKARVLSEIKGITSVPRKDGTYPTPEEAIAQLHSKTKEARGRIVESRIHTATRMVEDPASYLSESVNTWQEFSDAQTKITQKAEAELAQLQLLQHATHYELTQPGKDGKAAREKAFTTAWKENVEQPKKPGRAVKIEALYEDAVKRSPTNEKPLKKNLDENKIQYRGYEAPKPEKKSKSSIKVEIPTPTPNPEPISGLIIQEDLRKLDRETIDKEHVHWHPRALLLTDSHAVGYKGLEKRIRAELGPKVKVEFKKGLVYVDGQELPIYHGGDALDLEKKQRSIFQISNGFSSKSEYQAALTNDKDPKHSNAIEFQKKNAANPTMVDQIFKWVEDSPPEDFNLTEATEILNASLEKGRAIMGNHEAMFLSGFMGDNEQLLTWLCDENIGFSTFFEMTQTRATDIFGKNGFTGIPSSGDLKMFSKAQKEATCRDIREKLNQSESAKRTRDNIQKNVKFYNVINGEPQIHASIALDKSGKFIPFESVVDRTKYTEKSHQDFFKQIDTLTGFEAMDYLESQIHSGNRAAIDFAAYSKESLYGRDKFHQTMIQHGDYVMDQAGAQLKKKGLKTKPTHFVIGHTPDVGGKMIGKNLLGADKDGALVRVDLTYDKSNELVNSISATHNFGQSAPIVSKL